MATPREQFTEHATDAESTVDDGSAFVAMAIGQLIVLMVFWIAVWPTAFGIPREVRMATMLGGLLVAPAAIGMYWGVQQLSEEPFGSS
jgi:cytosine/uracil/thiamine/allantoin permease